MSLSLANPSPRPKPVVAPVLDRRARVFLALALFLIVWGFKLVMIDLYGSDLPGWDQLPREGERTYLPWVQHGVVWPSLVESHNEHRIAPTLAINLGLLLCGGQWDARVQLWVNGALHAAMGVVFFLWLARHVTRGWALASGLLVAVLVAQPIAYENLLTGFQSQFYFLVFFSLFSLHALIVAPLFSARWWSGAAVGGLTLITMGSGLLCAAPLLAHGAFEFIRRDREPRRGAANSAVALVLLSVGWLLHTSVPYHQPLHTTSVGQFFHYVGRCLAWPLPDQAWFGVIVWLPWLAATVACLLAVGRQRARAPQIEFLLAAGVWTLLQIAAVAYSRANGGGPAVRYGDVFALGMLVGFALLALYARRHARPGRWRLVGAVYGALIAGCLALALKYAFAVQLPERKQSMLEFERTTREFVLNGDSAALEREPVEKLAYPDATWLAPFLRIPEIRRILPSSVALPVPVAGLAEAAPSQLPPLGRPTRRLAGLGEWRSGPLAPASGWWKIETAGHLGTPGVSLELVAAADGRRLISIVPTRLPGDSWRAAYVRAPREPAILVARVTQPEGWLAFSEPVAMSNLSYFSWQLVRQGWWLLIAGGLFAAVAFTPLAQSRRGARAAG